MYMQKPTVTVTLCAHNLYMHAVTTIYINNVEYEWKGL